jgi:para-nitrobenzyl esterase
MNRGSTEKNALPWTLAFALVLFSAGVLQAQSVLTQYGPVKGILDGGIYRFLGIPFASPPVGDLRWQPPQQSPASSDTIYALSFRDPCPQKRFEPGDSTGIIEGVEDCLHLNIWTPQIDGSPRPVMVFIHGGGNQQGSAGQISGGTRIYDGKNMAARGDVVVVTMQYRLGPLGYLVHPGLELESPGYSGNYGVMDQIAALKWVKNNISAFGGDPNLVMVFGESAGGVNTGNLLISPLAAGLFQRACIQSASPVLGDYQASRQKGIELVDGFVTGGNDAEKIAAMRLIHPDSLSATLSSPLAGGVVQQVWQPVFDGLVFTGKPTEVFESGYFNQVPLMIGSNADEMSLSAPATVTPFLVTAFINLTLPPEYRQQALELYPPGSNNTEARASMVQILTDAQFTALARRTAQCVSDNQSYPVWRYLFSHVHTVPVLSSFGSYHGMELFYIFNNWENATLGQGILFRPQDEVVQQQTLRYWVNFARTGNPNGDDLTPWPEYLAEDDCYLEIRDVSRGDQCGLRSEKSDFWDAVSGKSPCSAGRLPVIYSLQINMGEALTTSREVVLNIEAGGEPTHYMASEDVNFADADWLPFINDAAFRLSEGFGFKAVYVNVKNSFGEGEAVKAAIEYAPITSLDLIGLPEIELLPNPFDREIYIVNPAGEKLQMRIYTADGRLCKGLEASGQTVDTAQLPAGFYLIRLETAGGSRSFKLLKTGG